MGAAPSGRPGCPELAFWTASIESVRMVFTHNSSRDLRTVLKTPPPWSLNLITRPGTAPRGARPRAAEARRELLHPIRHSSDRESERKVSPEVSTNEVAILPRGARKPLEWSRPQLEGRELAMEWLETDGLGGFACGTVAGARNRRYHGWYVPAVPPPRR